MIEKKTAWVHLTTNQPTHTNKYYAEPTSLLPKAPPRQQEQLLAPSSAPPHSPGRSQSV